MYVTSDDRMYSFLKVSHQHIAFFAYLWKQDLAPLHEAASLKMVAMLILWSAVNGRDKGFILTFERQVKSHPF